VELANGHRLWARLARSLRERRSGVRAGVEVVLEISPGDFSTGRIVEIKQQT
jgi:translation initiation factor IF-1